MDTAMNRRDAVRQGNRDDAMAPHGVFPCRGDDTWVTIAVGSDSEWEALKEAMGNPAWADGDDYGDAFLRWRNQDALEQHLSEWTCNLTAESVTGLLQAAGIAAFPSLSADQLLDDPHLTERNAFPVVTHVTKGEQRAVAPPWRFSRTPAAVDRWTPDLGEHNREVFCGLLGMDEAELTNLQEARIVW